MNFYRIFLFLVSLLFLVSEQVFGFNEAIYNYYEASDVVSSDGYISNINIYGFTLGTEGIISIPFTESQQIEKVVLYIYKDGQYVDSGITFTKTDIITELFYTGLKRLYTQISARTKFRLQYTIRSKSSILYDFPSSKQLLLLDSAKINLLVTKGMQLKYRIQRADGVADNQNITVSESGRNNEGTSYCFVYSKIKEVWKTIPVNFAIENNDMSFKISPECEMIIVPDKFADNPYNCISAWIEPMLAKSSVMPSVLKKFTDKLCIDADTIESMRRIFEFVRDKINYIAIENGLWAFRPQTIALTYKYKFGDCKAKALLLTQMLNYRGINAYFCIASTLMNEHDLDFPSVGNGDHAICYAYLNAQEYFLDPTMQSQQFGELPGSVIGKHILAIIPGEANALLISVPFPQTENFPLYNSLTLNFRNDSLIGYCSITASKWLRSVYQGMENMTPSAWRNQLWKRDMFEKSGRSFSIKNIVTANTDSGYIYQGPVSIYDSKTIHTGPHTYLLMNFMPYRLATLHMIPEGFYLPATYPIDFHLVGSVFFDQNQILPDSRSEKYDDGIFKMDFQLSCKNNQVSVDLKYRIPCVEISGVIRDKYNRFVYELAKTMNYAIEIK
jgi:hypothetical protein